MVLGMTMVLGIVNVQSFVDNSQCLLLSFPTFLIGNPGFCSRRTRTHGRAEEKNLDPR